jgi:phosphate transport system permease protein
MRFRLYGMAAIAAALLALALLFASVVARSLPAFFEHRVRLTIDFDRELLDADDRAAAGLAQANYGAVLKQALRSAFPEASGRSALRALSALVSVGAPYELRDRLLADPALLGQQHDLWLLLSDEADLWLRGARDASRLSDQQAGWLQQLREEGRTEERFAARFFNSGDSREPELAGIWGALIGSLWTLLVTLGLSLPIGAATALYLEEFAPKNRFTDLIEVNINNLAAVPSVVFGLLGLAVFLGFFGLPRSAPLVGGMVLSLMTLPTIIITTRAALKAVPPSIREAALGVGASKHQVMLHHVLPLALPGILTGTIIGMAQALGETAPLLLIGMNAFIPSVENMGILEPATSLPTQIFSWADSPERGFVSRTSAAILVLLGFLVLMNIIAITLRQMFQRKW